MTACDEHKPKAKGSCVVCEECKLCDPPVDCVGGNHMKQGLPKKGRGKSVLIVNKSVDTPTDADYEIDCILALNQRHTSPFYQSS
jgi:hypothetical protein